MATVRTAGEIHRGHGAEWNTTGGLAPWSSRRLHQCPSCLLTPWKCESEMGAKSGTFWGWPWVAWRGEAPGTWCSQVPVGLQGKLSAVQRLSNGGFLASTNSPSFDSCKLRTAGSQPHQTQAWTPSRFGATCLQCGCYSVGTPWTPVNVVTNPQERPPAWAPYLALVPDPEEGLGTPGPEDLLSLPVL